MAEDHLTPDPGYCRKCGESYEYEPHTCRTSNPRSLHFAEMLDRAETFSDRERGELADLLRAMTFEGGEAETCIERLTRERDTWRGHYQDLLDDAASVRQEMIRRDAERDRLRAALERIKRIGPLGVDTYPECYRRMHAIAVAALSGEPTSAVETPARPFVVYRSCAKHVGIPWTLSATYTAPPKEVCPICEPPSNGKGNSNAG